MIQVISPERFMELYEVDVSPYVVSERGYDYIRNAYLPLLMQKYLPGYRITFNESMATGSYLHLLPDGSGFVELYLTSPEGGSTGVMFYPVMDNPPKFAAIINPNSRDVNDAMARAGVKLVAYSTGLGLKLYTREAEVKDRATVDRGKSKTSSVKPEEGQGDW